MTSLSNAEKATKLHDALKVLAAQYKLENRPSVAGQVQALERHLLGLPVELEARLYDLIVGGA